MRARGLKHQTQNIKEKEAEVAPHAGAWIETCKQLRESCLMLVAPHAGAWIET